jgi:hypothetical protein
LTLCGNDAILIEVNKNAEVNEMKKVMYADTMNGKYDMTWDDVMDQVKENPFFTHPEKVAIVSSDGVEYTGQDLLDAAGVKNEVYD